MFLYNYANQEFWDQSERTKKSWIFVKHTFFVQSEWWNLQFLTVQSLGEPRVQLSSPVRRLHRSVATRQVGTRWSWCVVKNRLTTGIFYGDIIYIYIYIIYVYIYMYISYVYIYIYIYIYIQTQPIIPILSPILLGRSFSFFFYGTILGYITSLRGFIRWDWYDLSNTGGCDKHFMG